MALLSRGLVVVVECVLPLFQNSRTGVGRGSNLLLTSLNLEKLVYPVSLHTLNFVSLSYWTDVHLWHCVLDSLVLSPS